jgi:amidohydrolase
MPDFLEESREQFPYSQAIRRDIHRHPELAFQEVRTAGIVAKELSALGMEVTSGIAKTGVIGLLEGNQPGPVVLLRFDMDALPILEDTGLEYASTNPGVMHACGHDSHVAIGLTVARLLHQRCGEFSGTVKFVFQPAEEGMGGAPHMVAEGVLENPVPKYALALHVWNEKPLGWLGIIPGPMMAGAGVFSLRIIGRGGHGAVPHQAVDPVLAGAQIVTALQSIISRNVSPLDSGVVSVTQFHAGDAFNVIPQSAELKGTLRFFEPQVKQMIMERIRQIATHVGEGLGCQVVIDDLTPITMPVVNDPFVTAVVTKQAQETLPDSTIETNYRTMGSEDMSAMMEKIPGCYFLVGSSNSEKGLTYGHHHPKFEMDENVMPRAAALMAAAAFDMLK